jgi:hypothetical protein
MEIEYLVSRTLHLAMIKYTPSAQRTLKLFKTPFERNLDASNRWVAMADLVPWDKMAKVFFPKLSKDKGRETIDLRIVLGALMVSHIEDLSDERTIGYIQENIYAQYFVGLSSFQSDPVFVPSLFVKIRERLGQKGSAKLNDLMISEAARLRVIKHRRKPSDGYDESGTDNDENPPTDSLDNEATTEVSKVPSVKPARNRGTLSIDATVAPVHIAYPTDSHLLADCRRVSEQLIDVLYLAADHLWSTKPRTYRREAEKKAVNFSKKRRKTKKEIRQAVKDELNYTKRNFKRIETMLDMLEAEGVACPLSYAQLRLYWVIQEIRRQQAEMYKDRRRRVDDRIVSVHMPFIRPIKRGKGGGKNTEFGPKISASITEGFVRADRIDFDAFNESGDLRMQVEGYKGRFGYYPTAVLADKIYWTNANRKWLKERGIKIGGVAKGRKKAMSKYEKEKEKRKNNERNEVEGKFGEGKMRYGLDLLFTRRPDTIRATVNLTFLAMNLVKCVRSALLDHFYFFSTARERLSGLFSRICALQAAIRPTRPAWLRVDRRTMDFLVLATASF